jgi:putative ATP-dependent endonuclease of the OLD family
VTLLDLDLGRFQGGWGRIRYAAIQLRAFPTAEAEVTVTDLKDMPAWNGSDKVLTSVEGKKWLKRLEENGIYFSAPLDLDFAMLMRFPEAHGVEEDKIGPPDEATISAVLGKEHHGEDQYSDERKKLFKTYHSLFKLGSKPVKHLKALANLDEATLKVNTPQRIARLIADVRQKLSHIPE